MRDRIQLKFELFIANLDYTLFSGRGNGFRSHIFDYFEIPVEAKKSEVRKSGQSKQARKSNTQQIKRQKITGKTG